MNRSKQLDDARLTNQKEAHNYWGFANFPNQVFRRAVKNGFNFTLMVVGRSGLGKSTFINTLFLAEINSLNEEAATHLSGSTVRVEEKLVKLVENSVSLNLTLVDTPGFGDAVNNSKCWEPIVNYVESKFFEHFCDETRIDRGEEKLTDKCVHLCLYFIEPSGHGLKPLDIELMKQLHGRVNIVPVIAKADCLTRDELTRFKAQIMRDAETADIKLYKFPEIEDATDKAKAEKLRKALPFAVVGSNMLREKDGKRIRYREYPWGTVEVENMEHNDFVSLRDMIIRTNLIDMVDVTRNVHYENFRFRQMESLPKNEKNRDPFTHMEEERRQKDRELIEKREMLEKVFNEKTTSRQQRNQERSEKISEAERDKRAKLDARRVELIRLRHEINDLRSGNLTSSQTSLAANSTASFYNENSSSTATTLGKSSGGGSPPHGTVKKRMGTLGLFNRN